MRVGLCNPTQTRPNRWNRRAVWRVDLWAGKIRNFVEEAARGETTTTAKDSCEARQVKGDDARSPFPVLSERLPLFALLPTSWILQPNLLLICIDASFWCEIRFLIVLYDLVIRRDVPTWQTSTIDVLDLVFRCRIWDSFWPPKLSGVLIAQGSARVLNL